MFEAKKLRAGGAIVWRHPPPDKRYVKDFCVSLGKEYLEKDAKTYQRVVDPVEYKTETANANPRMLERSTVWRWLSFFGSPKDTLRNAFDIIRQTAPDSTVFRQISPITQRRNDICFLLPVIKAIGLLPPWVYPVSITIRRLFL